MSVLFWISIGIWVLFGIIALISPKAVKFKGKPVTNRPVRLICGLVIGPILGLTFLIIGAFLLFVGTLLGAPIIELFFPGQLPF